MAKTKRLAEESAEKKSVESKENLEPTRKASSIRLRGINKDLYESLVAYLETKPYAEVRSLLISLSQTHGPQAFELDATIIDE